MSAVTDGQSTATIKVGKGADTYWLIVKADTPGQVRADIIEHFGLGPIETAGLTLDQLIAVASRTTPRRGTIGDGGE
ncbi:hypothetical protein [Jiangella mangrovi]|uniref:Uncharacterized protein n=1 Tax=Jiangella mangrovi TaxID=1524084 RepID=A0A7W9GXC0_9ACTN|nr:hypothetical protein [Jiangella mangrovi]MBB5791765.1 hypothetical protein [Jiangella mangrovi]